MINKFWSTLPAVALRACVASTAAMTFTLLGLSDAQAYTVKLNGRTAGNPLGQPLRDIGLDSRSDIGRTLDPTTFSLAAAPSRNKQDILATSIIKVLSFTTSQLSLRFDVSNGTNSNYQAALMSLWFRVANGTDPSKSLSTTARLWKNVDGDSITIFDTTATGRINGVTGGFKDINMCVFSANGCSGGDIKEGLQSGQRDSFNLDLFGNFAVTGQNYAKITLSDMGGKFQTQDGSYELAGVPEPLTILGSAAALGFAGAIRQRVSRKKQANEVETVEA